MVNGKVRTLSPSWALLCYIDRRKNDQRKKEIETMPLYEVTYEEAGEMKSEVIEAPGPVEATRLFVEQNRDRQVSVVCVVLQ